MFQNIIEVLILSAIQGISEFLPISSSAHLILVSSLYEFKSNSLIIDISLHLGSLFAIIYFFRNELLDIKNNKRILSLIILGSIPLFVVGYILHSTGIIYSLRNIKIIAWTTLVFGILLYIADKNRFDKKIYTNLSFQTIFFISIFQILSLIPGVSRAGITITAARILKFNRLDSSKISFLLSIPALAGASFIGLKDLLNEPIDFNYLIIVAILGSFIFSFITVKFFLIYINKFSMNAFVIYRIIIALILFFIIYS
jgi:undecaprenyl-diphosphatase